MFVTQGPVDPESRLFVGRAAELKGMQAWLTHTSCVGTVLGARQTGKTSLLLKLRHTFRDKCAFVYVNLESIEGASTDECFVYIADEMAEQLVGATAKSSLSLPKSSGEFLDFLQQLSQKVQTIRIAVLLDEIGALRSQTANKLARTIRAIFTSRLVKQEYARYVFILSGATDMLKLTTGESSPLWNVTESIYLGDLSLADTEQLLVEGFADTRIRFSPEISSYIYAWTGGHPYWTQLLAATLVGHSHPPTEETIRSTVEQLFQTEDKNLPHVFRALDKRGDMLWGIVESVLKGGTVPFTRMDAAIAELELAGVIRNKDGCCTIRNNVYREAIRRQLVRQGRLSSTYTETEKMSTFGNAHALLIGIAAYRHIRPLAKAATDARDLYDTLLQNGYSQDNISLLLDEQATKPAISDKLDWLARRAGPDDTVVIFFSGHGAQLIGGFWPGEYLCPVEATLDKVRDTFISDEEFTTALRAIRAGRLAVFLDACHAGGVGEPKDPVVQVKGGLSEAAYTRFLAQGRVIIASCKPDEVSYELAEMRNSLFTHYLLEGLRGGAARQDGTIWMSNLFGYVYECVSQHNLQHPFQKSAAEDFIIAMIKQPQPGPRPQAIPQAPATPPTGLSDQASVDPTKLRKAMHNAYDRPAFEILCKDLGLDYHDLRGETLETKMLYLIDHFQRRRQYEKLVRKVLADHSYLADELR